MSMDSPLGHHYPATPQAIPTPHRTFADWLDKWGERIATMVVPSVVAFGTMVGGLWLTNRDQDQRLEGLTWSVTELSASLVRHDAKLDKLRDDTRQDFRDLRAEIRSQP